MAPTTDHQTHDAEGLQVIENHDFPEVVPGQDFSGNAAPARRSSMSSPEAFVHATAAKQAQHEPFLPQNEKNAAAYVAGVQGEANPPEYSDYSNKNLEGQEKPSKDRRICGLSRAVFAIVAVVAVLVILGIALGAGLGVGLSSSSKGSDKSSTSSSGNSSTSSSNSSSSQYQIQDKAGMALLNPAGSSTLYSYYVDQSGTIVETAYENGAWSKNNTQLPTTTNVTSLATGENSPIAAVSYSLAGNTFRQLFFLDATGSIATVNTTGSGGNWSTPYNPVSGVASQPNTLSLAAVAATNSNGLNGIRVYLGSSKGYIQEIGMDFPESSPTPIWHIWATFPQSDSTSGVASAVVNNINHLYLRNSTTSLLQQWTWDYINVSHWTPGANSSASQSQVAAGGSIAVASDGQSTDYIFYQEAGSVAGEAPHGVVALYTGGESIGSPNENVGTISAAGVGYSLAATYVSTQAVVMNQNASWNAATQNVDDTREVLFSSVGRNGQSQGSETQTGDS